MKYKLYKHKTKHNSWKVVYNGESLDHPDWQFIYDVEHLKSGKVVYT